MKTQVFILKKELEWLRDIDLPFKFNKGDLIYFNKNLHEVETSIFDLNDNLLRITIKEL